MAHSLTSQHIFFLIFIEKSRDSKNNITDEAGRGRCQSDVKVRRKDVNERKKKRKVDKVKTAQ